MRNQTPPFPVSFGDKVAHIVTIISQSKTQQRTHIRGRSVTLYWYMMRVNWKLAVVQGLLQRTDAHVQAANILTQGGMTHWAIVKLSPLEVTSQPQEDHALAVSRERLPSGSMSKENPTRCCSRGIYNALQSS